MEKKRPESCTGVLTVQDNLAILPQQQHHHPSRLRSAPSLDWTSKAICIPVSRFLHALVLLLGWTKICGEDPWNLVSARPVEKEVDAVPHKLMLLR
jgi:hypothetical protein